jgi:hypothetical protein
VLPGYITKLSIIVCPGDCDARSRAAFEIWRARAEIPSTTMAQERIEAAVTRDLADAARRRKTWMVQVLTAEAATARLRLRG